MNKFKEEKKVEAFEERVDKKRCGVEYLLGWNGRGRRIEEVEGLEEEDVREKKVRRWCTNQEKENKPQKCSPEWCRSPVKLKRERERLWRRGDTGVGKEMEEGKT